jgi:hypothetical protein
MFGLIFSSIVIGLFWSAPLRTAIIFLTSQCERHINYKQAVNKPVESHSNRPINAAKQLFPLALQDKLTDNLTGYPHGNTDDLPA